MTQPAVPQLNTETAQPAPRAQSEQGTSVAQPALEENPNKSYLVALLLSYLLGSFGADRFYLGKMGTGILKLITFGGFGIWQAVDVILIGFNKVHAKNDPRPLEGYAVNRGWVKIVAIILIVVNILVIAGILLLLIFSTVSGIQSKARQADGASQSDENFQVHARNTERLIDLKAIQSNVEIFWGNNVYYPSLAQMNDPAFRTAQFKNLNLQAFQDPQGSVTQLAAVQTPRQYAYIVTPSGCDNVKLKCTAYKLVATKEDGQLITLSSTP